MNNQLCQIIVEYLYNQKKSNGLPQFFNNVGVPEGVLQFARTKGVELNRDADSTDFREAFWYLVGQGITAPGGNNSNEKLPWVSITKYGIECFENGNIVPYDPEGFLTSITSQIQNLDSIVKMYLEEAIGCFLSFKHLSSVVMTGCALERTIIHLTEEFYSQMSNATLKTAFENDVLKKDKIKKKFDGFIAFIERENCNQSLTQSQKEKFDNLFKNIFSHIRITRNEAGHPTGREVQRDEAQANLLLVKVILLYVYNEFLTGVSRP